jgi:Protein of unknown function (DUF1565)/Right handed beta helix region
MAQGEASMNADMNRIALRLAILSSLSHFAMGCLDLDSPACAGLPTEGVIYVHGGTGDDDNGSGQCIKPYKTITKALAAANTSTAKVVHVRGEATALVYGTATTGERFPLVVDKNGLTLEGDGESTVIVRGGGACAPIDETENCALAIVGTDVTIRGLQVENIAGHGIRSESSVIKIEDTIATNCATAGILLKSDAAWLTRVTTTNNGFDGLRVYLPTLDQYTVNIDHCTLANNGHRGLYAQKNGKITSTSTTYANNSWSGVAIEDSVNFASKDDTFENNNDGVFAVNDSAGVTIDLDNALVQLNRGAGVQIAQCKTFKMRDSKILDNTEAGLSISAPGETIDLGSAADPGRNTLQSSSNPNEAGICFTGTGLLSAHGNYFAHCPPLSNADLTCTGGADIGGSTMFAVDGCLIHKP